MGDVILHRPGGTKRPLKAFIGFTGVNSLGAPNPNVELKTLQEALDFLESNSDKITHAQRKNLLGAAANDHLWLKRGFSVFSDNELAHVEGRLREKAAKITSAEKIAAQYSGRAHYHENIRANTLEAIEADAARAAERGWGVGGIGKGIKGATRAAGEGLIHARNRFLAVAGIGALGIAGLYYALKSGHNAENPDVTRTGGQGAQAEGMKDELSSLSAPQPTQAPQPPAGFAPEASAAPMIPAPPPAPAAPAVQDFAAAQAQPPGAPSPTMVPSYIAQGRIDPNQAAAAALAGM